MTGLPDVIRRKQNAYRRVFPMVEGEPAGDVRIVLADLAKFCGINKPPLVVSPITRTTDPVATGVAIGKHEVYRRIEAMLLMPKRSRYQIEESTDE